MDNRKTNFTDNSFHMIIFDPPHGWGEKTGAKFYSCRNVKEYRAFTEKWGYHDTMRKHPPYYGMDKYQSKTQLLGYVNKALQEFYRILEWSGVLMMKWCELEIPFDNIKPFLRDWDIMIKLRTVDTSQTRGKTQTWWIILMKREKHFDQLEFDQIHAQEIALNRVTPHLESLDEITKSEETT